MSVINKTTNFDKADKIVNNACAVFSDAIQQINKANELLSTDSTTKESQIEALKASILDIQSQISGLQDDIEKNNSQIVKNQNLIQKLTFIPE